MVQPHVMASSKLLERSDALPRIGGSVHDMDNQINVKPHITINNNVPGTQKKRKGPNVPPHASRLPKDRKQTLAALPDFNSGTDLTVSGVNNQSNDENIAKVEEWSSRNEMDLYTILNPPDERANGDEVRLDDDGFFL